MIFVWILLGAIIGVNIILVVYMCIVVLVLGGIVVERCELRYATEFLLNNSY